MRPRRLHGLAGAAGLAFGLAGPALGTGTPWNGDDHAAVRLIAVPGPGNRLEAGIAFRFGPGWHGSWRTPGDAGFAPQIDMAGSTGLAATRIAWPAPERLVVEGLQTYVYSDEVILPVAMARTGAGPATWRATIRYAACSEICVPYRADLALMLPEPGAEGGADTAKLAASRARIPGSAAAADIALLDLRLESGTLSVDLHSTGAPFGAPDLFVEGPHVGAAAAPKVVLGDGGATARLRLVLPGGGRPGSPLRLTIVDGARRADLTVDTPPPSTLAKP